MPHDSGIDLSDLVMPSEGTPSDFWFKDSVFWTVFGTVAVFTALAILWVVLMYLF